MRFLTSGDYHLKQVDKWGINISTEINGIPLPNINSRLADRLNTLNCMVAYAIDPVNKIDMFIILGDLFDKINPSEKLRRLFVQFVIAPLIKAKIPIIIVRGNHDTNNDVSSFETEAMLSMAIDVNLITYVKTPEVIDFGDFSALFLPYGFKPPVNESKSYYCFAHHGIDGAETGVGVMSRKGEECKIGDFSEYPVTVSGHYHKSQVLANINGSKFYYAGSSNRWDMGERLDDKGALLIDTEEKTETFIDFPDRSFKQFVIAEGVSFELVDDITDCCVKVRFEGSMEWIASLNLKAIKASYEKLKPHKLETDTKITTKAVAKTNLNILPTDTDEMLIKKYSDKNEISKEQLEFGLKIFRGI